MYFDHIYSQLIPDPLLPPFPSNFMSSLSLFLNPYNPSHVAPILLSGGPFLEHDQPMKGHTLKNDSSERGKRDKWNRRSEMGCGIEGRDGGVQKDN